MSTPPPLPAPLPQDEVQRALLPVGEARMLPTAAYVDADVFAWEQEHVFGGGWFAATHVSAVREPGAQRAVAAAGREVLLVRGADRVLRGFANACRHRGHELLGVGDPVCRASVRCPYHGWTYDLDGALRRATGGADLDADEFALAPVRVEEHLGWVFVNAGSPAEPIAAALIGLDEILGPYDAGALVPCARHEYVVEANWKVLHENYQECLHCPRIHPEFCGVSPPESGDNIAPGPSWIGGRMDLASSAETMSMTGRGRAAPRPGLDEQARRRVGYFALLPNLLVSAHPDYVLTHRLEPLAPDRTRVECEWLVASDAASIPGFDPADAVELWDITNRQDWAACESVQRGLSSSSHVPGPLTPR
ncbi:MAG: aromatic ring-hydroxylating dioxygenase subunit alpha, partial [Acidimicrobiia bacterium]|nr:aromatic ring-hydroxylating dioxygenase subunit alpha [Acidimicrobiia bacterium]